MLCNIFGLSENVAAGRRNDLMVQEDKEGGRGLLFGLCERDKGGGGRAGWQGWASGG